MLLTLFHGSQYLIEKPIFGKGKAENDYGLGFYCTEDIELAKEWACPKSVDGYANCYKIETRNLAILNLNDPEYTILHWLSVLVSNRRFGRTSAVMAFGVDWLKEHFPVDLTGYDLVRGYRADDSYFSFARAFLSNTIPLSSLSGAMRLGNLGEQVVLKSKRAFDGIRFVGHEIAPATIYYPRRKHRDETARRDFQSKAAVDFAKGGLFMRDIIAEKVEAGDGRLR